MKNYHIIFAFLTLIITACGSVANTGQNARNSLKGEWILQNDRSNELGMSNEPVNIKFAIESENDVSGFAGCNYYGGTFEDSPNGNLNFSELFSTKRACPDLDVENKYLTLLNLVNRFEIKGNDLYLYQDNLLLLHFEK